MGRRNGFSLEELPENVKQIYEYITAGGYKVYLVGGCIRDRLLSKEPEDWDMVTNAPADFIKSLPYRVVTPGERYGAFKVIINKIPYDVTTFREGTIHQDLLHRDFTVNAIAYDLGRGTFLDPAGGIDDLLKHRVIRAVDSPEERFTEDPLRVLRGIRFSVELGFPIEVKTYNAIKAMALRLKGVSPERIKDEFNRIILSEKIEKGIRLLKDSGLLKVIIPELLEGEGITQRGDHMYDVLEHNIKTAAYVRSDLSLRLAALLHDVGKPRTLKEWEGGRSFPGHHIESAVLAGKILKRMKYPTRVIKEVVSLINNHLFIYNKNTPERELRKLMADLGEEGIFRLIELLYADRKAINPAVVLDYVEKLEKRVREVLMSEGIIRIRDLEINGNDVKEVLNKKSGPEIGYILKDLWEKVIDDPSLNKREILLKMLGKYQGQ
ncbi:Poly(A) polymerase I [Koleobacter methoxysyntrophicus]|uniref:Poly(A) polymerase I n=1 Tax=Koleobacter methoxysyntrophicus TaxID=2751313 RepID=A0A8A0RK75_9FIRM|nr:HD domain-containing protein [Koleobacter methoxysyntrophicus]QSQ08282.1 Poly(A) polymerase I [Koleobacter methoxysyntrophicus]